jgi:hypothetical protein
MGGAFRDCGPHALSKGRIDAADNITVLAIHFRDEWKAVVKISANLVKEYLAGLLAVRV